MKIKLQKNWRNAGQVIMAGTEIEIKDKNTIKFLEDNGYLYKEEKKEKKSKVKIAKENN
tara:strand:- start:174 stop:350 length:177 start_codon:yes stop_codon:yes gene_type:complete